MRVLIIEDYLPLAHAVAQGLREAGYAVDVASDGKKGLALVAEAPYDAIILDLMLPKLDGLSVLTEVRRKLATPILVLSARDTLDDRVRGLDAGADDYLTKPFEFSELIARLRAIIRRRYNLTESTVRVGDLEVDTAARRVRRGGVTIELSALEYAVLEYLAARRGQVVSRAEISEHVYDFVSEPSSNVIDVYIGYIRKKIDHKHKVKLIHTRRGLGYLLDELE